MNSMLPRCITAMGNVGSKLNSGCNWVRAEEHSVTIFFQCGCRDPYFGDVFILLGFTFKPDK